MAVAAVAMGAPAPQGLPTSTPGAVQAPAQLGAMATPQPGQGLGPTEVLPGPMPGASPVATPQPAAQQQAAQAAAPAPEAPRAPEPSVPDAFSSGTDAGPSVWSTIAPGMGAIDKSLLPSALPSSMAPPTATGGPALPPPSQVKPARSEKTWLIVLGVLAVLAVVALVAVLKLTKKTTGSDPVSIGIGDDPSGGFVPPPTATASATATVKSWGPKPKPKSTKADDIYDEP